MNAKDYNGHVPDDPGHDEMLCQGCLHEFALAALTPMIEAQEAVYKLAAALGISRDELNTMAGIEEPAA